MRLERWLPCLVALCLAAPPAQSATPWAVGLGMNSPVGSFVADEWAWALRGGGVEFQRLTVPDLVHPAPELPLLVLDSVPLSKSALDGLDAWVRRGGLLVYAGAGAALREVTRDGKTREARGFLSQDLLGARFAGFDPGLIGHYPDIVVTSPLLNPLIVGDALRLGVAGVDDPVRVEATDAEVLARAARLSFGPGGTVLQSDAPTILSRKHGQGRVVFLTFSPGRVAACYPEEPEGWSRATDCSGAGSAHALMRWLVANLLWEERRLQIPLRWETPGDHPHGFIVTGDLHTSRSKAGIRSEIAEAIRMAEVLQRHQVPVSYYVEGFSGYDKNNTVATLRERIPDVEISTHGLDGTVFSSKKFPFPGGWRMFRALQTAESLLNVPNFPDGRRWLLSLRSHGWISDFNAWWAMHRAGIGLVFDQVTDTVSRSAPWWVPPAWYDGGEQRRLFVPIFERSIATSAADFRLDPDQARDMASVASAQPEPVDKAVSYSTYSAYIQRWHGLFKRLAMAGGLLEVWLWHPGGVQLHRALDEVERTVSGIRKEDTVTVLRGDVASNWYANRERCEIATRRDAAGAITGLEVRPPASPLFPLPPGSPDFAGTIGYWVIGPLQVPGWTARAWTDVVGRTVTVLTRRLPVERHP